jgi:hypothetical protein
MIIKHLPRKITAPFIVMMIMLGCLHASIPLFAQSDITVKGKITSQDDASALPGVNVIVKGTSIGTTTDANGEFSIKAPDQNSILVFSFIGYTSQEVVVGTQTNIDIAMSSDIATLSEIVVVGYGEQKRETLTGSVSQI